jgi:hypothetical protein
MRDRPLGPAAGGAAIGEKPVSAFKNTFWLGLLVSSFVKQIPMTLLYYLCLRTSDGNESVPPNESVPLLSVALRTGRSRELILPPFILSMMVRFPVHGNIGFHAKYTPHPHDPAGCIG